MKSDIDKDEATRVTFEQPLNERMRAFLRLEFLFDQYAYFRHQTSLWDARAALHTLLDVLSVLGNNDFKSDLVKHLYRQRAALAQLADRPGVDDAQLNQVLSELDQCSRRLEATLTSYPAAVLRESDLLAAVLNRFAIPGGTCNFDLPSYHGWLSRPHAAIIADLDRWYGHLDALDAAIRMYLRLLREGTESAEQTAQDGLFMYRPRTHCELIRLQVPAELDIYPEVSANHYRVSIRFMRLGNVDHRHGQIHESVPFGMQCCAPQSST